MLQTKKKAFEALRQLPGILPLPPRRETLPFSLLEGGLPKACLVEVSGAKGQGKTEAAIQFLAENPSLRVAWLEDQFDAFPPAFPPRGLRLERLLFVEAGQDLEWAALQVLRSGLFQAAILKTAALPETSLRRLQLAAEQAQSVVLLLADAPAREGQWALALQLEVERSRRLYSPDPLRIRVTSWKAKAQTL